MQATRQRIINRFNSSYYIIIVLLKNMRIQLLLIAVCGWVVCWAQPTIEGYTRFTYPNGQVSSEGMLVNGKPEGYWKSYYEDGKLKSEGGRLHAQLDSTWKFYDADGKLTSTIEYKADKKNGITRRYGPDGELLSEELFANDVKQGDTRLYYPDGKVQRVIPFKEGKEEGLSTEYEQDGRIITLYQYRAGMLRSKEVLNRYDAKGWRQGIWRGYYPNGKPQWEGYFVDDKRQGIFKEFDVNGNLKDLEKFDQDQVQADAPEVQLLSIKNTYHGNGKVASIGSYSKDGKKEGLFRQFDDSGKPSTAAIYKDDRKLSEGSVSEAGLLTGRWTEYYGTGEKRADGEYKDGKKDGPWTFYHRSGAVEQKGNYVNGLPQGEWVWFFEGGARHREEQYRKGKEDGPSVEYDSTGAVITQGEYIDGLKDGKWYYHVGDHTENGAYKDGLKDGEWVHTFDNGRKSFIGRYANGEPDGKHRWYWPNGMLKEEGKYSAGLEQGDFIFYDETGYAYLTIKFKDGAEVKLGEEKLPPPFEAGDFEP